MTGHALLGLEAVSLADYLSAVGLLRAVACQHDPGATLAWRRGVPVLDSALTADDLPRWLSREFVPSPLVSPWNAGSGFAGNGKSKEAERNLELVERSTSARLAPLREAVTAARAVVAEGRARGWAGGTMWDEKRKTELLTLCRNRLPDAVLPWLDAALALDGESVFYNPLAGTGGNLGRQELFATYLRQVLRLIDHDRGGDEVVMWAEALVSGREHVPYLRGPVGQFDPGRAGGIHSSVFEKQDDAGFVNPWRTVLTCEGLLLFASSVARRNNAGPRQSSPFVVRSTPYGYGTAAPEETKGEFWAPLWAAPVRLPELEHLLGEGRAQYGGRQARSGFDFARAAGSLGVDRNLTAFRRFVFAKRLGQNPLAVRAGDITVGSRTGELALLREAYDWTQRLREDKCPAGIASLLRRTRASMFALAAGAWDTAAETRTFVRLFGRLHEAVARSERAREGIRPFQPRARPEWVIGDGECPDELVLAAALASLAEWPGGPPVLRASLTRGGPNRQGRWDWSDRLPLGVELGGATLAQTLAAVHQRRLRELADRRPDNGRPPAFTYPAGPHARPRASLVQDFVDGTLDDHLLAELLRGLLILGWRTTCAVGTESHPERDRAVSVPLATLLPFYGNTLPPMRFPLRPDHPPYAPVLRPRADWANRLRAGHIDAVLADAQLRMRQQHCPPTPALRNAATVDGTRLAAALLLPVTREARSWALATVSVTTDTAVQNRTRRQKANAR
ncbi:type I-U CRISPR-associated protein Csx17 [Streptomyces sp. MS19]|uniref:type I-G CRISPR-associated protein Cas8g1/Csx17 n=1 Tax=Streptomyces sp. MS19 TaxID=3385972 RepID=UPI0039A0FBB3